MHRRVPILAGLLFLAGCGGTETDNPAAPPLPEVARSSLGYDTAPQVSPETQAAVTSDLNDFGLDVLRGLAPSDQNFVLSPVSGFLALTMTSAGAQATTADEMKAVLYPNVPMAEIHPATNLLGQRVRGYARAAAQTDQGEKKVEVNLANDDFVQKGFAIEQPFLDTLAVNYDCGVELVDYVGDPEAARGLINNWVAKETANRIQDLLGPGAVNTNTLLVLVNALRLYASWNTVFDARSTQPGTFHGVAGDTTADMMHGSIDAYYAAGTGWVAVDVPYYGGSLVFTAVLPDAGQFDALRSSLDAAWLANLDATSAGQEVALTLPKFKLTGPTLSWKQTLQALGMATLFEPGTCNLTGINPNEALFVENVFQQAFLELNEAGTEAAAATAVVVGKLSIATSVVLDRPFLFFLRERGGPVLFAGQIVSLPG